MTNRWEIDDLLIGSDDEEEDKDKNSHITGLVSGDVVDNDSINRLHQLLSNFEEDEDKETTTQFKKTTTVTVEVNSQEDDERNINDLISSLEIEDNDRYLTLESSTISPQKEKTMSKQNSFESDNENKKLIHLQQEQRNEIDMIGYFDKQMEFNENSNKDILSPELEWDTEGSADQTPSDIATSSDPIIHSHEEVIEAEAEYAYDCIQLKERLDEIDNLLGTIDRDMSGDRSLLQERITLINSLGCVKDISLPPHSITTPQELTFGRRTCQLHPKEKAFAYLLRPDIRAENILNLVEQILLSIGGSVLQPPTEDRYKYLHFQPLSSSSSWSSISCHLTTNHKKQRALVLIITPSPTALLTSFVSITSTSSSSSSTSTSPSFLLSSTYPYSIHQSPLPSPSLHIFPSLTTTGYSQLFIDSVYEIFSMLSVAFYEESMTLYSLHHPSKTSLHAFKPMDSLVDPFHIRELYDTYFKELEDNVHLMSSSLLESIEQIEKQCARLMTLLRPIYDRCHLSLPLPPTKSNDISHFLDPITSLPSSVASSSLPPSILSSNSRSIECSVEMARLIILRARRLYKQQNEMSSSSSSSTPSPSSSAGSSSAAAPTASATVVTSFSSYQIEITSVLKFIYHDILTTISRYQEILTTYRTQIIQDRTNAIDIYKTQLILSLNSRQITSNDDLQIFKQFSEKFRIVAVSEPYLYDVKVCYSVYSLDRSLQSRQLQQQPHSQSFSNTSTGIPILSPPLGYPSSGIQSSNNRNGILYITFSHLYYTSYDIFLLSSIQRILPIDAINKIGIIRATLITSDAILIELDHHYNENENDTDIGQDQDQNQGQNENQRKEQDKSSGHDQRGDQGKDQERGRDLNQSKGTSSSSSSSSATSTTSSIVEQIVFNISSSTLFYVDRVIDLILWIKEIRRKQKQQQRLGLMNKKLNSSSNSINEPILESRSQDSEGGAAGGAAVPIEKKGLPYSLLVISLDYRLIRS